MEQVTVETAVDLWVRQASIDPDLGVPNSAAGFAITGYHPFLLGHLPPGASEPTSGSLTHLLELRFMLTTEETLATIEPIIERLRTAVASDPELAGRLDKGVRLELGDVTIAGPGERNPRGGPVVIIAISVRDHR